MNKTLNKRAKSMRIHAGLPKGVVSRFMSNPGKKHWEAVKWLCYLKCTSKIALCLSKNNVILEGYSDADLGGCSDTRKSITRFFFTVGGSTISWMS
uniref:Retrovirus-related Pol polyprotein from transposon TNT 1-94 n=1 Tax=Cajanus cajan TaxID=3821 RepID=A0A151S351_CAJCA|nr:Retrovirus-related Pol polyprotein from transposon TNT 1-94 [Cajanus cajan]